jgi:hypothetical protein
MLSFGVFVKLQHRLPPPAAPSPNSFSSSMIQPHCFQTFTHFPAQRAKHISFPFNHFRTISIATEGVPLCSQFGTHTPPLAIPILVLSFHALTGTPFCNPFPFIFIQQWGYGGCSQCSNVQPSNHQTIFTSHCSAKPLVQQFPKARDFFPIRGNNSAPPGV